MHHSEIWRDRCREGTTRGAADALASGPQRATRALAPCTSTRRRCKGCKHGRCTHRLAYLVTIGIGTLRRLLRHPTRLSRHPTIFPIVPRRLLAGETSVGKGLVFGIKRAKNWNDMPRDVQRH